MISKLPILEQLLMQLKGISMYLDITSMNKISNKFLLAKDKFMPEMDLRQAVFTDSAGDSRYIY